MDDNRLYQHAEDIAALKADSHNMKKDVAEIKSDVRMIHEVVSRNGSPWKILGALAAFFTALGIALSKILSAFAIIK